MVEKRAPLAERMRPHTVEDIVGQHHLLDQGKPLSLALKGQMPHSMVLWGPPGCGKTTIARLFSEQDWVHYHALSAVTSGVKEIRQVIAEAEYNQNQQTLLFVDEVHRFNKSQQDAFLPVIESGTLIFIGATTENPSFSLNRALLSRCPVYRLQSLDDEDIRQILERALTDAEQGMGSDLVLKPEAMQCLVRAASGDVRRALGLLENLVNRYADAATVSQHDVESILSDTVLGVDRRGDDFYDLISALHKSVRGSDADAALYWVKRMLTGGVDPNYLLRRLVRIASEDIGNADPRALELALNAWDSFDRLGMPEGELAIMQAVAYLSIAAKSNAIYLASKQVDQAVSQYPQGSVPAHLRNAPTTLSRQMGHGKGYRYAHDEPGHYSPGQRYFPDEMPDMVFYRPTNQGLEIKIQEKLARLVQLKSPTNKS